MNNRGNGVPKDASHFSTLVELLRWRAQEQSHRANYIFLADGEGDEVQATHADLDRQARAIASKLQHLGIQGQRALLIYQPGLEYIAGFFGCLYAGVVAVPSYPPDPFHMERTFPRFQAIVRDSQPSAVLTTSAIAELAGDLIHEHPDFQGIHLLTTDDPPVDLADQWRDPILDGDTLAFLQYTSGSTATPKGVMLTHGNLLANLEMIYTAFDLDADASGMVWLPPYHDMGLIGGILQPLYAGVPVVLMSPLDFLQRPFRWLQALSRYRIAVSGGPNFSYDLCVRKITAQQKASLDLTNWRVAFSGAEPVRKDTIERFSQAFASCGFRKEAFYPCYGLAEATLMVSGGAHGASPVYHTVSTDALNANQAIEAHDDLEDTQTLVGCGTTLGGQRIVIADPASLTLLDDGQVGEIWVGGRSVAQGYWNQPEESQRTFAAFLAGSGEGPFLRTGDLGFLSDGELFVTGRIKDLIIVRGRNYYPQDIELTVERSHPALRPGCTAAFSLDGEDEERLVVVQEVYTDRPWDADQVISSIRQAVAETHDLRAHTVVLIHPRTIPKTSSGKIQRGATRSAFLNASLEVIETHTLELSRSEDHAATTGSMSLLARALTHLPPSARKQVVVSHLQDLVASTLGVAPAQVDPEQLLSALGIDSMGAMGLSTEIETTLGVTIPLTSWLRGATLSDMASEVLGRLAAPPGTSQGSDGDGTLTVTTEYPLSHGQRALWFLQQLNPKGVAYNLVQAARVPNELDLASLERAFQKLIQRHTPLRSTIAAIDGEPLQTVQHQPQLDFRVEDVSGLTRKQLDSRLAEEVYRPFDLETGPLMRVTVLSRSPREHVLVLGMHHIITDLWSFAVLLSELGNLYTAEKQGTPATLAPIKATYADYVKWQSEMLQGPEGERLLSYWKKQLAGHLPVLDLPTDRPRTPSSTFQGQGHTILIGENLTEGLRQVARNHNTTLFATALAAFQTLLHRYTYQDDILVGSPSAGRISRFAGLIGYFVNPLVLRANLSQNPTFSELLTQVRATVLDAFDHSHFPFPLLVDHLHPMRDASRMPLFQVMFAWQKTTGLIKNSDLAPFAVGEPGHRLQLGDLVLESFGLQNRVAPFDLTLHMAETETGLAALLEYDISLFDRTTVARMAGHFQRLIESIVADPDTRISDLELQDRTERQRLLESWRRNVSIPASPIEQVIQLIEAQVERTPDAIALVSTDPPLDGNDPELTYGELNRRANQLAHYLVRRGLTPGATVGLCMDRTPDAVIAMLGVLKAGGTFIPMDVQNPGERLHYILQDTGTAFLISQQHLKAGLPESDAQVIYVDTEWPVIEREMAENPGLLANADLPAYMIYTSGSTGLPKGVPISNREVARHVANMVEHFDLGPSDHVLQFAAHTFDQALEQILSTLASGARLILRGRDIWHPADFPTVLEEHGLTVINLPPAYWEQVLQFWGQREGSGVASHLRLIIIGGDALSVESVRLWQQSPIGHVRLLNAYGPTETTITATTFEVPVGMSPPTPQKPLPIGHPLPGRAAYVLDRRGHPVPLGVPGELCLGGSGLALGYQNQPRLTAEKFVPDAFAEQPGARLYRTGDLVRELSDGNLEFLGRIDLQVKIRGFRIELGEIEAVLSEHPALRQAIVAARESESGDRRLVAYVVPVAHAQPAASELRAFLEKKLPAYMIPALFVFMEALPLSSSGKFDRLALPTPDGAQQALGTQYVGPRTPVEQEVAGIWAQVLGLERVGMHDNFFDLGGHSLLATQIISRLRDSFSIEIPLRRLFERPDVARLSEDIERTLIEQEEAEALAQLVLEIESLSAEEVSQLLGNGSGSELPSDGLPRTQEPSSTELTESV